jgi:quercetin dioxygenase-like cupin family protein
MLASLTLSSALSSQAASLPTATGRDRSPGVSRTDLQRHDLSITGREVVHLRVDFAPGAIAPRHSHPGEEIIYVLKGTLEYRLDGAPPRTLAAGGVLFVPAGAIHMARNVGSTPASELATYIVEKGKPLVAGAR